MVCFAREARMHDAVQFAGRPRPGEVTLQIAVHGPGGNDLFPLHLIIGGPPVDVQRFVLLAFRGPPVAIVRLVSDRIAKLETLLSGGRMWIWSRSSVSKLETLRSGC